MPRRSRQPTARSIRELARQLGRNDRAVRKWIADERWKFGRKPPWNVAQVRTWAAATLAPNPAASPGVNAKTIRDMATIEKAKLKLLLERAEKLRLDREIKAGQYTTPEEIERGRIARIGAVKETTAAVARRFLPILAGPGASSRETERVAAVLAGMMQTIADVYAGTDGSPA
jgi:hypothetical protein